jgi:hypothetical protein
MKAPLQGADTSNFARFSIRAASPLQSVLTEKAAVKSPYPLVDQGYTVK